MLSHPGRRDGLNNDMTFRELTRRFAQITERAPSPVVSVTRSIGIDDVEMTDAKDVSRASVRWV